MCINTSVAVQRLLGQILLEKSHVVTQWAGCGFSGFLGNEAVVVIVRGGISQQRKGCGGGGGETQEQKVYKSENCWLWLGAASAVGNVKRSQFGGKSILWELQEQVPTVR